MSSDRPRAAAPTEMREIVRIYRRPLYFFALRFVRDPHTAQDLVQDGLSAIHRKRHSFTGTGSFRGWIFQVVRNLCLNHLERHKPHWKTLMLHSDW